MVLGDYATEALALDDEVMEALVLDDEATLPDFWSLMEVLVLEEYPVATVLDLEEETLDQLIELW